MKSLLLALLIVCGVLVNAVELGPYDDKADAKAQVRDALKAAAQSKQSVLVIFGANWCGDCRALDKVLHDDKSGELIASHFRIVKVSIGDLDQNGDHAYLNEDVAKLYGVPLAKGIPTVAVLAPDSEVLYVTRAGELADARHMSSQDIFAFFQQIVKDHPPQY